VGLSSTEGGVDCAVCVVFERRGQIIFDVMQVRGNSRQYPWKSKFRPMEVQISTHGSKLSVDGWQNSRKKMDIIVFFFGPETFEKMRILAFITGSDKVSFFRILAFITGSA